MVLEAVVCKHCGRTQQVQRFGKTRGGTQRYRCGDCRRTFVAYYTHKACDPVVQAQLIQMAINGSGVRDTARVLHISRNTVSSQLKKKRQVMQVNPKYANKGLTIKLKVDEMWSFVSCKSFPRWLWWVEDASNGEVVAFVFGRRTHATFRRLLALLESAQIQVSGWITDAWWAYFDCLDQSLRVEAKALLQSLERKHLTLRTRLKRLTRRTICFSKSVVVHDTLIGLFINHYFFDFQRS